MFLPFYEGVAPRASLVEGATLAPVITAPRTAIVRLTGLIFTNRAAVSLPFYEGVAPRASLVEGATLAPMPSGPLP